MATPRPQWQAYKANDYDSMMTAKCSALLNEIVSNPARRQDILADPRSLHRELFAAFTPPENGGYAGTYRGTAGTALADRRSYSESQLEPGTQYEYYPPSEVPARMDELLKNTHGIFAEPHADHVNLIGLTYTFCRFGKIHPFLDGNGHVQRAIFASMATEFGYPLSARFAIHPRPFDRLLALALEIFSRAPTDKENEELGLVAEYLAFFLDGPFNAPRKPISDMSPRS